MENDKNDKTSKELRKIYTTAKAIVPFNCSKARPALFNDWKDRNEILYKA